MSIHNKGKESDIVRPTQAFFQEARGEAIPLSKLGEFTEVSAKAVITPQDHLYRFSAKIHLGTDEWTSEFSETPSALIPVRFLRPHIGNRVELRLHIKEGDVESASKENFYRIENL
ncbi:hypothetical protein [Pseudomonas sp. LB3P58]|jgi:hypothetical protein